MEIVKKGWGHEEILINTDYCAKILVFEKNKKCSWHFHKIKAESFLVGKPNGKILLKYSMEDDIEKAQEIILNAGDHFHIPIGMRHQMFALEDTELIEFSTHDSISDSIRIIKGD